jgi:hypothetical protein
MFFALAALLIQPQVTTQISFSAEKVALIQPTKSESTNSSHFNEISLALAPVAANDSAQPAVLASDSAALPNAPEPALVSAPVPIAFLGPGKPMTVSVSQLRAEGRHNQQVWMGLGIASHGAATFDAWTTRRAITRGGVQEMNPLLKPFAGNASLYAVIQVGPALMDYAGKKMMYSKHSWVRHMWWLPQSASFATSLFCGAHNLGVN